MRSVQIDFIRLPEEFHKQHKLCLFLLSQIEDFLVKDAFIELRVQTVQFDKEPILNEGEHILDYLRRIGEDDKHDKIMAGQILNGVIGDICHFLQSALFASLQQRLTVSFALIRKPFVYDLLVILRLYLTDDFLDKFNEEANFDTTGLSQGDIKELLKESEQLLLTSSIKATDIYDFVFNAANSDSIINLSNKALHPSTTRSKHNLTEIQNINFTFSTIESHETQWQYIYARLPLLLLYLDEILECIVFGLIGLDEAVYIDRLAERAEFFTQNNTM